MFERKAFLRSFIRRIDLDKPNGGTIEYTLPLVPACKNGDSNETDGRSSLEVLSIGQTGGVDGI